MEWKGIESYCGSKFWDSNLTWHTDYPEFTQCFEQTILVWIPIVCLWIFLLLDIFIKVNKSDLQISWNWFNLTKITANSLLIVLVIFDLGHKMSGIPSIYPIAYWTPIIQLAAYIVTLWLTVLHVRRGYCSSGCLFLFWALSVLLNAHSFRSDIRAFQNDAYSVDNITDTISYMMKIVLFGLNIFADTAILDPSVKEIDKVLPLNFCSALSRFTISWYDKLAFLGFRRPLAMGDLWLLNRDMTSEYIASKFDYYWMKANKKHKSKTVEKGNISAIWPSFRGWMSDYTTANILRILSDLFAFASPLILKLMLGFVKTQESNWKGFFYATLLVATSILQSCIDANAQLVLYHFGIKVKNAIIGAIFKKSLFLSNSARSDSSFGEVVNLMSLDADKMMELVYYLQFFWAAPLKMMVSFILLWNLMGPSVIAGISIMVILLPVNWFFSRKIHAIQTRQMSTKDTRIKSIYEILSGIKLLKLNAWEPCFEARVNGLRSKEVTDLKQMAYLSSIMSCFWSCVNCIMLLSTFAVFVLSDENNVLDVETAFTAISLFSILHSTMHMVPYFINFVSQAHVSMGRINKFMNSEEIDPSSVTHTEERDQLVMEKCTFSWEDEKRLILKDINIRIKPGSLVAIVGPVGSGKSSLMSAFLGDMNKITGRINTVGSIAYVPQVPWIQNDTVKGNIIFGKKYSSVKYKRVVESCALTEDLVMLHAGDMTEIGEKGINLSGGQKQRISLARAVYFDSDIYFLDDPLSAVDSLVGKHIFENVIGPTGLLRKKTRLLVTHLVSFLPETDYIIVLNENTISEMGTYQELMDKNGSFKELILNYSAEQNNYEDENDEIEADLGDSESSLLMRERKESQGSHKKSISSLEKASMACGENVDSEKNKGELVKAEHTETGQISLKVFRNYINAMGLNWWCLILVSCFIKQGFSIGANYWISIWSTDMTLYINSTHHDTSKRDTYLGVYGLLIVCQAMTSYLADLIPLIACLKAAMILHTILVKTILRAPLAFFDTTPLGRIIARFSKDIESLDTLLPRALTQVVNVFSEVKR